ncbi:MAG TPA: peptidase U32 [Lentisphaeria bacterium]|nr:peptidase U32 [Lentisphaeria bacterium]
MISNLSKPELLAPAGNLVSALTAFDAGADAVYGGLKKFNARERTENFSSDEMAKLITYAHSNGKKVYVTFNTLIKESEIISAAEMLSELVALKPDAVIIQDIGVLHLIREYFPSLVVHASTQMGIHNSEGVKLAASMGIKRVILERQVTLDEIRQIKAVSPIEIELFIHGALCCSLSGKCLFSSFHGGFSGNRGKCKQPCRYNYFSGPNEGYYFSTRDLCSLELIPEMKKVGITSLKIEGRLRKQDYVKNVVSAYRLMLDAVPERENSTLEEAMDLLGLSYGREFFTGFTSDKSFSDLVRPDSSGVSGSLCGRVANVAEGGFSVLLSRKLHLGDRIRIQSKSGKKGTALTITEMTVSGRNITEGRSGETCFITTRDREVLPDGFVYKIGESIDEMTGRISRLPLAMKRKIDFKVAVSAKGFNIDVKDGSSNLKWNKAIELAKAQKHPLGEEKIKSEFSAASSEILAPGEINAEVDGEYFIPLSVLKDVRREFWKWAEENVSKDKSAELAKSQLDKFFLFYGALKGSTSPREKTTAENINPTALASLPTNNIPETEIHSFVVNPARDVPFSSSDEIILPHFCPEGKLSELRKQIIDAYGKGARRFRLTSIFQLGLLKEFKDLKLSSSYPLPVCNSLAVCELRRLGFSKVQAWPELEEREIEVMIAKSAATVEIFRYGRLPLMMTRAEIPATGELRDSRGNRLNLKKDPATGMTCLYSDFVICIPEIKDASDFFDFTNASPGEKNTSYFNSKSVWE